jgi:hypothetical protein
VEPERSAEPLGASSRIVNLDAAVEQRFELDCAAEHLELIARVDQPANDHLDGLELGLERDLEVPAIRLFGLVVMATAMRAAMRPYSMAVAPASSQMKAVSMLWLHESKQLRGEVPWTPGGLAPWNGPSRPRLW